MTSLPGPYLSALGGDLRSLPGWAASAGEWSAAARGLWWFAQPDRCPRPTTEELMAATGDAAAEALSLAARASLLELDLDSVRWAHSCLLVLSSPRAQQWARIIGGHLAALASDAHTAGAASDEVYEEANRAGSPTLLIEAVLLRAAAQMTAGEITEATSTARRASRMAQTEHLWLSHYFASLFLARLRRLAGRPHLAGLIARACLEVTAPVFHGWLRWELLFAGILFPTSNDVSRADYAASLATHILVEGERQQPSLSQLRTYISGSSPHRRDFEAALAATTGGDVPVDSAARSWLTGVSAESPPSLSGLTPPAWAGTSQAAAPVVLGTPARPGRRLLGFALPSDYRRLAPVGARPARPEAVAAALTLAGPQGIGRAVLFENVYGFAFRKGVHEPTFKVVRHQTKKLLESCATISTEGDRIAVQVHTPYAVVDPRCQQPLQEVMLRFLATSGGASAKDMAKRLDVPLRTVQSALREMTEDGVCAASKEGRRVAYVVEDTTFCELTVV